MEEIDDSAYWRNREKKEVDFDPPQAGTGSNRMQLTDAPAPHQFGAASGVPLIQLVNSPGIDARAAYACAPF